MKVKVTAKKDIFSVKAISEAAKRSMIRRALKKKALQSQLLKNTDKNKK